MPTPFLLQIDYADGQINYASVQVLRKRGARGRVEVRLRSGLLAGSRQHLAAPAGGGRESAALCLCPLAHR